MASTTRTPAATPGAHPHRRTAAPAHAPAEPVGAAATLRRWQRGIRINHMAHYKAAARCMQLARGLGLLVVALSAIVGTTAFATLSQSTGNATKIVAGMLSVCAALFAALQTFLAYPQREAEHHKAAGCYGALRREIEALLASPPSERELAERLDDIRVRWDEIDRSAPAVPQRVFEAARTAIEAAEARQAGHAAGR